MKNIKLSFSILLCLFFLLTSTTSHAITTSTSVHQTESKTSLKKQAKLERLKKKLSSRIDKIKRKKNRTEKDKIKRAANAALFMSFTGLILCISQLFFLLSPYLVILSSMVLLSILLSFSFYDRTAKKIRESSNPEQYKKFKKRAKTAVGWSLFIFIPMLQGFGVWAIEFFGLQF